MQKTSGISKSFTLGKKERLKSRKLIERVFREGKSFAVFPFRVYYLSMSGLNDFAGSGAPTSAVSPSAASSFVVPASAAPPPSSVPATSVVPPSPSAASPSSSARGPKTGFRVQAGFSASSRNFKKAVDRNRIKRLMREAYRLQKDTLVQKDSLARKDALMQKEDLAAGLPKREGSFAVFFIYTGRDLPDYQTVYDKIGLTLQKLEKHLGG